MSLIKKIFLRKTRPQEGGLFFQKIEKIIGFAPIDITHYENAFTHRSHNKIDRHGNAQNYERLEFLGDAMLGSVVAAHLYREVPGGDEGYLTKMRSKIVSREHLNELGKDLNLIQFVMSKIPKQNFGENIHGNIFEALVGAIYLDRGYNFCEKFIHKQVIEPYVDIPKLEGKIISYKSLLIEWCQKEKKQFHYDVFDDDGKDSQKYFGVKLYIEDKIVSKARATSKKKAEEIASKRAYFAFQQKIDKK